MRSVLSEVSSPSTEQFRADVLRGLRAQPRELPCKYFYDAAGSELFERITELEEYYPTRTELAIMTAHAAEMAGLMGPGCLLVEFGSGSSAKTRLLLRHLPALAGYVPIDVSADYLQHSARTLAAEFPKIPVLPLAADFTLPLELPVPPRRPSRRIVYFPGSTIGNFTPDETVALLKNTARLCGPGGGLLLGADMHKDIAVLEAAYNDARGITAAFNRNILVRINRELNADFAVEQFEHRAFYNTAEERIEMHLVSRRAQRSHVGDVEFSFAAGESIRTEYSYKYRLSGLRDFALAAGMTTERVWQDERAYFSVLFLTVS